LSVAQVYDLAARMPEGTPYGLLVLVATFGSLRWGEVTALRRADVDESHDVVRVRSAFSRRYSGEIVRGQPKSRASVRAVVLPRPVMELLAAHLSEHVHADPDTLVFTGDKGGPMQRGNFNKRVKWVESVAAVGAPGLHFHDLRHTGNTLAASSGASTRELMHRMGHSTMRAALIYQHATSERDREIASAMDRRIAKQSGKKPAKGKKAGGRKKKDDRPER
jgi:integrase